MNKLLFILLILANFKAGAQTSALAVSDSLYAVGNYSEAIVVLKNISSTSETINLKLARVYRAQGDLNEAEEFFKLVLQQNPDRILSALEFGKLLMMQQKLEEADSIFRNLTERYPENVQFQYQLGLVMEKLEDSTALDQFKIVVQLDSTHQNALYKLAKSELMEGQYQMAINYSLMGLHRNPNNTSLLSILAQSYSRQQLYKKAISEFEKLVLLGQANEFIQSRLGFAYSQLSEYEEAIKNYNLALEIEDKNSETHYNLGKLYALTGDLKNSEMHLLMALLIKKQPVDAEFLSLGLTYKLQQDYKKALKYFNNSLEENPDNERALYERAVAGDNYFKDLQTKIDYYQAYLNKYESSGNEDIIYLAKTRISDLKKQQHLAE